MPRVLRIAETAESTPGRYRIDVDLEGAGPPMRTTSALDLVLTAQDREDLRWYLEDYLLFPLDPAPRIAARIEARIAEVGDILGKAVFFGSRDATRLWDRAREDLATTRVEIVTDVRHAASVPWELIPFRSVSRKLVDGLDDASREVVALDVLRPPTFDMLSRTLRAAKDRGKPYHVVHFDGHGAYLDEAVKKIGDVLAGVNAHVLGGARTGAHGYLVFEHPDEAARENGELVDGPALGKLLVETGVPVLVLNACRSAHADPPAEPEKAAEGEAASDAHGDVASFGSLALEVMDKGVSGVVAMRYNVFVVTAAQFVADLYAALVEGRGLGEAVSRGRKQLAEKPERTIAYEAVRLQDWSVPVVYEAERLPLFPVPAPASRRPITLSAGARNTAAEGGALVGVPQAPDVGFFGRDETLLAVDRAFDRHPVVLLHAYAGSGKTSTAAEFARWYAGPGGVDGPVLWTSFERRMMLSQALDALGRVFGKALEQNGIQWLALSDAERRSVGLQLLKQVPVLWVWDNVEPVAGFPAGTASAWSAAEQRELVDFLREARGTKARFLLTSRRAEETWLGELPARVSVPGMPMRERVEMAKALASKRGARLEAVEDWRPLLKLTGGNPLAITVLVGQALRDGVRTKAQVEAFVGRLRAGESAFDDDAKEGRSKSLGASLSYGFETAFGVEDRKRLALLHLFQGFVNVGALKLMGDSEGAWCLPEVRGLTRETGIALLDKAAEVGLLTAHSGGYYGIHPAVPWYFRGMFEEHYTEARRAGEGSDATSARRAFVEAMGELGNFYHDRYGKGHRDIGVRPGRLAISASARCKRGAQLFRRRPCWRDGRGLRAFARGLGGCGVGALNRPRRFAQTSPLHHHRAAVPRPMSLRALCPIHAEPVEGRPLAGRRIDPQQQQLDLLGPRLSVVTGEVLQVGGCSARHVMQGDGVQGGAEGLVDEDRDAPHLADDVVSKTPEDRGHLRRPRCRRQRRRRHGSQGGVAPMVSPAAAWAARVVGQVAAWEAPGEARPRARRSCERSAGAAAWR